ncbi:MAG: HAD-IB family hydrolase [Acidimicrobiia bacterium]
MIAEGLAGKRIAVTGATGFLGTAVVERLLRCVPDCELVLLIRAGRRSTVQQRLTKEILRNDAFDRLRSELGKDEFFEMAARRVQVITGDVGTDGLGLDQHDRSVLASCDIVIHSAAAVSFDSPLDSAVEVNLLGPTRIAETLKSLDVRPHMVSVSTCYVAGNRRGAAPEERVSAGPFHLVRSWRKEVAAARRLRSDVDAESRQPKLLDQFRAEARRELGAAGTPALAAKTEQRRTRWCDARLVEAGRARAASLGWPDAYAYTKALGEEALMENAGDIPVSIVRPSIIESALAEPRPGWIRGFRMAEPVIISLAKGLLTQFPGVPEGTVDVIPVDLVVGAICAVAAAGPERAPAITQVASGSSNPLKYRFLVESLRSWFAEHPLYDDKGQPIIIKEWDYPTRGKVDKQLNRADAWLRRAEDALHRLPLRGAQAQWATAIEDRKADVERAKSYVELYGSYAECEAIYGVHNLMSLLESSSDADRAEFCFDPRVVRWGHYIADIHLPSIVEHARVRTTPGSKTGPSRSQRMRTNVLAPERHVAAFDLENTLIASNVVESYSWLATRHLNRRDRAEFVLRMVKEGPSLLALDRKDRGDFLRFFYRRYEDAPIEQLEHDAAQMLSELILTKSFPAAIRRVRAHRAAGHRTLLITGALDVAVEPLRPLFDDIVAAKLARRPDGTFSGELTDVPPTGETRAQIIVDYCKLHGLDVEQSVAYADSTSDLPMLEVVGFPVAVNPETRLATLARKRGWLVEHWDKAPGTPKPFLPITARPKSLGGSRR